MKDALDVWGVHGMGGALGSIMIGAFADENVGGVAASGTLFGKQLVAVLLAIVYSYVVSYGILFLISKCFVLKPTEDEIMNLDESFHGESAYCTTTERESKSTENSIRESISSLHSDLQVVRRRSESQMAPFELVKENSTDACTEEEGTAAATTTTDASSSSSSSSSKDVDIEMATPIDVDIEEKNELNLVVST